MDVLPEDYTIRISIDSFDFRRFSYFNAFYHRNMWRRPLLFFALLSGFGALCLLPVLHGEPPPLPALLLFAVAILIPLAYFLQFDLSVRDQCKTLHLFYPQEVYTIRFSQDAFYAAPVGQQAIRVPWDKLLHAYRTKDGIYIYADPARAFIIPAQKASDSIWTCLTEKLGRGRTTEK